MDITNPTLRAGAWLMSLGKLVAESTADRVARLDLDEISLSYRGAAFYSSIRSLSEVSANRAEAFRRAATLSKIEWQHVTRELESNGLITIIPTATGDETLFRVPAGTREDVYRLPPRPFFGTRRAV